MEQLDIELYNFCTNVAAIIFPSTGIVRIRETGKILLSIVVFNFLDLISVLFLFGID